MRRSVFALLLLSAPLAAQTHAVKLGKHTVTLPKGFTIELVADSPQVDRPVTAAFDDKGRLYVADSSGSNAKPTEQVKNPTHRVVMLESTKKDGKFDKSTVFADKLSFLQGTMWRDGSLYVATPPTIQKLTDTDGDGVADKREVWFDGGVLTGCANDVHGPYPGPDGRIYWTKGAFAKQELTLGNGKKFTTRAAHIYSAKADGTDIRVEMTGGMDNPVDVAFNSSGEMFFTTTFLQHPANGRRDGIIHNTYGAVYGKDHDVLNGHPRADPELGRVMTHLGPAAPAGLHCYHGTAFGDEFRDNLFACQFNMAKVSRHILKEKGSTYETIDSDFVVSDNRDFHPTDVIEDADGSLLIVDTGGWYKLCCPSSVMEKKDVLGAIYRVRRTEKPVVKPEDPTQVLSAKLKDNSALHARRRLVREAAAAGPVMVPTIFDVLNEGVSVIDPVMDVALVRALIDIGNAKATREGLKSWNSWTRRAALIALDQMPHGGLTAAEVVPHLSARGDLEEAAWWITQRHPEWGEELAKAIGDELKVKRVNPRMYEALALLAQHPAVQQVMADHLDYSVEAKITVMNAMRESKLKTVPECWIQPLSKILAGDVATPFFPNRASLLRSLPLTTEQYHSVVRDSRELLELLPGGRGTEELMLLLSAAPPGAAKASEAVFARAMTELNGERPEDAREALVRAELTTAQMRELAGVLPEVSPAHLPSLLKAFERSTDEKVGVALVTVLRTKRLRAAVQVAEVKAILARYPKSVQDEAAKLYAGIEEARKELVKKLDTILDGTQPGDVRKGQAVFNSAKAACAACHKIAYVGGQIGPDLTKIGGIRSDKDLLEAIVFPSASFVRSYEPVRVDTKDGKSFNGILKTDLGDTVTLTVSATEEVRIDRKDIDEMKPGTVSIMPAGLDQQLTKQELADLVAFLRSIK